MSLVQSVGGNIYNSNTVSFTLTSIPVYENALVIAVLFNQGSGTASVSVPSCTFTRRAQVVSGSFTLEIWESTGRHMHASDNTVTVVGPTSSGPLIVYAMEFSGINTFDVTGSTSGTSSTVASGSATTTVATETAIAFIFNGPNNQTANGTTSPLGSITNGYTRAGDSVATHRVGNFKTGTTTEWVLTGLYKSLLSTGATSTSGLTHLSISQPYIGGIVSFSNQSLGTDGCSVKWGADGIYQDAIGNILTGADVVVDNSVNDITTYIEQQANNQQFFN